MAKEIMTRRRVFYPLCALALAVGIILGTGVRYAAEDALRLPPCPTEDSTGCYWDASQSGNGVGADVVTP